MTIAPASKINETLEMLASFIDDKRELDAFSFRRHVSDAEKIDDEPLRLMLLALAHGAAKKHYDAINFFQEAVAYRDEIISRNYLSYLSHTGEYELYRHEAVRLAREITSLPLSIRARNAAYADGDGELSLFFARKAISMTGDDHQREAMESEVNERHSALTAFINATHLSTEEISVLTRTIVNVAKKHDVLAVSHEYLSGLDGDAAIMCDVLCKDDDVLSDMDIDIATELAMIPLFADKNLTAWYRGRERQEVQAIL